MQHKNTAYLSLLQSRSIDFIWVYKEGVLSLWKKGQTGSFEKIEQGFPILREYTKIKEVTHLPLLLLSLCYPYFDRAGGSYPDMEKTLNEILNTLKKTGVEIEKAFPPGQTREVLKKIITRSLLLMEEISILLRNSMGVKKECIDIYLRDLQPWIHYNTKISTEIQLKSLNDMVVAWREKHGISLEKTRVLILGLHGPRKDLIEFQYFVDLFQELGFSNVEDDQVYYAEVLLSSMPSIDIKRDLIEGFIADAEYNKVIGQMVLGRSNALFRDVLGDYARPALDSFLEKRRECPFKARL